MSLIIATGSNIGDCVGHLREAQKELQERFQLIAASRVYRSKAVDNEDQPDFFNQVLEFKIPSLTPELVMKILLQIETGMGRVRGEWRGPRTIDMDMIFWGLEVKNTSDLILPHPRWLERSFVVRPFQELPFFQTVKKSFIIPESFQIEASPV